MVVSVNTNETALTALQNLVQTNRELAATQNRINTGFRVSGAKDNGSIYAIAQNLRSDVAGLTAVKQSLDRGISAVTVALSAGESISDLLLDLKAKAAAAADQGKDEK